jgi:hypothetical protein
VPLDESGATPNEIAQCPEASEILGPAPPPATRTSRRESALAQTATGRKIYLSDELHYRLRLAALQRGKKVSQVAAEILDRGLPEFSVSKVA